MDRDLQLQEQEQGVLFVENWEEVIEIPFKSYSHVTSLWIGGVDWEILLLFGSWIVVYNLRWNARSLLKEIKGLLSLHLYVESLVSSFTHKTV